MRLLIIRHADPDYYIDGLTETGKIEAELLAKRLCQEKIDAFYVSPLGRAKKTAEYTLKAMGREAEAQEKDWLREFPDVLDVNGSEHMQKMYPGVRKKPDGTFEQRVFWDIVPAGWMDDDKYFSQDTWQQTEPAAAGGMEELCAWVWNGLDEVLAEHGYHRKGRYYTTEQGNEKTIAFFCHFGVACVMLSHLWNVSPFVLWHSLCFAPSSVTQIYTEERQKGIVSFRTQFAGDCSHLYAAGRKPSFAARFCETFEQDARH